MKEANDAASQIYKVLEAGQAPAQIGKPIWEKDMEAVKMLGARSPVDIFGAKDANDDRFRSRPINFGSKSETVHLAKATRMRLFGLKCLINDAEIQAQILHRKSSVSAAEIMDTPLYKNRLAAVLKAFNVTDFATWIPLINARFYFEEYEIPYLLANEFDQQPMDSATMQVDGALGLLEGKEESDTAYFDEQANTSAAFTVTSRNNVTHAKITEDLTQDSAPAIINKLRKEVMMGTVRAYERAVINGDITGSPRGNSHMDSDIAAVSKHFSKGFYGLRKLAMANSANGSTVDHGGDAPNKNLWRNCLKAMGEMASDKSDLLWIYGPKLGIDLVSGAIPELFTAFAFGGPASNVTGQVPPVFGVRGVESRYVREDLNASGVYAAASTKTIMLLVKKSRFQNYVRAATRVWATPSLANTDQMLMTAKTRHAFAGNPQSDKELSVILGYNIETVS